MPAVSPNPDTARPVGRDPAPGNGSMKAGANGEAAAHALRDRLLASIPEAQAARIPRPELRQRLALAAERLVGDGPDHLDLEALVDGVVDDLVGLGPLDVLFRDFEVSDILINGPAQIYVERGGVLHPTDLAFRDTEHLLKVIGRLTVGASPPFDPKRRMVDARLPDGSRLNVVITPPALNGPLVSIRRFGVRPLTAEDLVAKGALTVEMLEFLAACVRGRLNMVIAGGTGSGKTTLLNALSRFISDAERVVTIEDTAELELQQRHVAKLEAIAPALDGTGGLGIRELVRNSLRMRPDRILVGECRGAEVLDMLQAMSTGHDGSLTTIHANSTRDVLSRIELMIGLGSVEIPVWAIRKLIGGSIHLIVQVERMAGGKRKVVAVSECAGMEGDVVLMHDVFRYVQTGVDAEGVAQGQFRATGIRLARLAIRGKGLPLELFAERV
jgi:pilus assembly protein CpaF